MNTEIQESDLRIFVDTVKNYFFNTTAEAAEVVTAFLADDGVMPNHGYTGAITLSGQFEGCVYFTATQALLTRVLASIQEADLSEANLLDAVGEIANTIAGNARQHFGAGLDISVPTRVKSDAPFAITRRDRPFVIELKWRGQDAAVVVDISPSKS